MEVGVERKEKLRRSFKLALRSLLTAASKQDVENVFAPFAGADREALHRLFVHVIKSLHSNIEEDFESICLETEVDNILDKLEELVEEQRIDIVSRHKTSFGDAREKIVAAKKDEILQLTSLLENVERQNNMTRTQLELLKMDDSSSATKDAVNLVAMQLKQWNAATGGT